MVLRKMGFFTEIRIDLFQQDVFFERENAASALELAKEINRRVAVA